LIHKKKKKILSKTETLGAFRLNEKNPTNFQGSLVCKYAPTSVTRIYGLIVVRY